MGRYGCGVMNSKSEMLAVESRSTVHHPLHRLQSLQRSGRVICYAVVGWSSSSVHGFSTYVESWYHFHRWHGPLHFIFSFLPAVTRWWLLATSVPLRTLTSLSELCHWPWINTWSISFCLVPVENTRSACKWGIWFHMGKGYLQSPSYWGSTENAIYKHLRNAVNLYRVLQKVQWW